ncbi:hypothetical protein WS54_07275 [Burkholderia sp. NRF60-BP8]|nr:hypothetical protein WS54_07275 [Burkholderia sp. NRF60-BP8]
MQFMRCAIEKHHLVGLLLRLDALLAYLPVDISDNHPDRLIAPARSCRWFSERGDDTFVLTDFQFFRHYAPPLSLVGAVLMHASR